MIHNHALIIVLAIAVLLLVLCRDRPAGPVHVTPSSPARSLGVLLAGAAVFVYVWRRHQAPAGTAAAPRPQAVTHTITRYVPVHNWPVSGFELTLLGLGALAAAILIVRLAGRYFGR